MIVDDDLKPIGVVSLKDIIRQVLFAPNYQISKSSNEVALHILSVSVAEFSPEKRLTVIEANADSSIESVVEVLTNRGLRAIPVRRSADTAPTPAQSGSDEQIASTYYAGWFDCRDLVAHVCHMVAHAPEESKDDTLRTLIYSSESSVGTVSNASRQNPLFTITPSTRLRRVLQFLAEGAHRIAVVEEEYGERITQIISQSDITHFLARHLNLFGRHASRSIADLRIHKKPVD